MKAKEFVKEAIKLPPGVADQAVQYISGPMLPKPNGQYRLQDVLKRVKEIKDAIARAKQSGRLDVNSTEYKNAVAEIKKWADWLEASQAPAQPGNPVINIGEANYNDPDFNPRIEVARLENLIKELPTATYERRKEIDKEIREIKNQLRLYQATLPPEPAKVPVEPDEGGPYMLYTDVVQAGQFGGRTLKGAKNSVQRAMMQQQAHVYAIATDNKNKIVAVWYPTDKENKYNVGDTYRPPTASGDWQGDTLSPRYPPGHPYAGAVMPPKIPVVTDWSQLPDGGLAAWMQGGQNPEAGATAQQKPERYMGQAQRVDEPTKLSNEDMRRMAKLAGVPIKEEWNANMGDIYEAANTAARAFYCIGILTNRAFQQREDPQGELSERLADVDEYREDAEMAMDDLQRLGASLTYNPNSPRMFVLDVPKMEPYTFDVKEIVDTAVN